MENTDLDDDIVTKLRASYYFMGALLGKYGYVRMKMPGGCYLGPRPIDLHLKGFEALGAKVTYDKACYTIEAKKLKGAKIFLDIASVGATINIMMAAVYAEGRTTIENAAKEPEIIDIATLLNKMGARIRGAGTNVIKIDGVKSLSGCFHEIIPDRIEAGTFIIIAAAMAKRMVINNIIPQHLEALLSKLKEMGVNMEVGIDRVIIERSENLKSVDITTKPYPGFATDLQQPLTALLTQAEGEGRINETIYIERFKHCLELEKMGADIELIPAGAIIKGPTKLYGTSVSATDLRCGAAMIVAGLIAEGVTSIKNVYHIDRGYSEIDKKLSMLGAKIWRENI
jgi:UDP-N-acetylglucosamine 1-carboxyvinyltransferase